jgi:hypothetical protein
MIKSILNGLGSVLDVVGKIASAINKSTAFKLFKGFCSATVGIPLALVGTVVVGTAYLGMQAASTLSSQLIKSRWGIDLKKDIDWAPILEGTEKFMRSIWEDFGVYSHLKAAKFIGDQWAERQSEAGYGNAGDDPENVENYTALNPLLEDEKTGNKIAALDDEVLSSDNIPSTSPLNPSLATTYSRRNAMPCGSQRTRH